LALDFHLKDLVGVLPSADLFVRHKGDEASLEGAETAFDFTFGLRSRGDQMGDFQGLQGALWSLLELGPKRLRASV
jgi:hypothetical protein